MIYRQLLEDFDASARLTKSNISETQRVIQELEVSNSVLRNQMLDLQETSTMMEQLNEQENEKGKIYFYCTKSSKS
jgi:hypothetical protein